MSSTREAPPNKRRCIYEQNRNTNISTVDVLSDINTKVKDETQSKRKKHNPKFRFKTNGDIACLSTPANDRVPLILTDIQHLLLHSLLGNLNLSEPPRWYVLDKCGHINHTTCLIVEGMSIKHWEEHNEKFIHTKHIFKDIVEILTPSLYNGSLVEEFALVPLSEAEKENLISQYGSMNLALEARKDLNVMMKAVFPIRNDNSSEEDHKCDDKFPRTQLIMSAWQLIEENYPLPLKGKLKNAYSDYVMSKEMYKPVTPKSPMFGIDCEMCMTSAGSELTRVSVVNEKYETIYESFVKPYNKITDYLTRYSGITKPILDNVTKRLEDVQNNLREILPPDAILIGQSLNTDLHALKMMHPYVIDTSLIYNFTGTRTRKPKLKTLAREFLNEDIQSGKNGHCSVEDSLAALKLVQLKLTKSIEFGDAVHTNREKYKEYITKLQTAPEYALSIFNHMIAQKKTSLVIGCDDITGDYHTYLSQAKESMLSQLKKGKSKKIKLSTVDDKEDVITTFKNSVNDYNFTMAHLKVEINDEIKSEQIKTTDKWIENVWSCIPTSSLCVIVFGGTTSDNGVAMIKMKSNL